MWVSEASVFCVVCVCWVDNSLYRYQNPTRNAPKLCTRLVHVRAVGVLEDARAVGDQDLGRFPEEEDTIGAALVEHEPLRLVVYELLWVWVWLFLVFVGVGAAGVVSSTV